VRRTRHHHDWLVIESVLLAFLSLLSGAPAVAEPPPTTQVCGELTNLGDIRVLTVWGTAHQRGFAHGWLLAEDMRHLWQSFIDDKSMSGGPFEYQERFRPLASTLMVARPIYQREMQGLAEGFRARLGDAAVIRGLERALDELDFFALNCMSDRFAPFCSSFAAWGSRTSDGETLCARNLDWPRRDWLIGREVVLVERASDKPARAGWAGVTWPGFIGCLTGMNEHGLTMAIHDVPAGEPDGLRRFTPRGLVLREALEQCAGPGAFDAVAAVFRRRSIALGTNAFAAMPRNGGSDPPAAVFEYDARRQKEDGVTIRSVGGDDATWLACSNHFRRRAEVTRCPRYEQLVTMLSAKDAEPLDVDAAWRIAASVNVPAPRFGNMWTYHTVLFEPAAGRLHVALSGPDRSAGHHRPTAIDLLRFLGPRPRAAAAVR